MRFRSDELANCEPFNVDPVQFRLDHFHRHVRPSVDGFFLGSAELAVDTVVGTDLVWHQIDAQGSA